MLFCHFLIFLAVEMVDAGCYADLPYYINGTPLFEFRICLNERFCNIVCMFIFLGFNQKYRIRLPPPCSDEVA